MFLKINSAWQGLKYPIRNTDKTIFLHKTFRLFHHHLFWDNTQVDKYFNGVINWLLYIYSTCRGKIHIIWNLKISSISDLLLCNKTWNSSLYTLYIHTSYLYTNIDWIHHDCWSFSQKTPIYIYRQTSNISCTIVDNSNVVHSDAVGASPVAGRLNKWIGQKQLQDEMRIIYVSGRGTPYIRDFTVSEYDPITISA